MEPRPLLELNVQQAIASILQKPRWWSKWQDPSICSKWWSEVELQLLHNSFEQSLVDWSHGQEPIYALRRFLEEPAGPEKQERLTKWLDGVVTDFRKGEDEEEVDEEDVDEVESEKREDQDVDNDADTSTKKRKREEDTATRKLEEKRRQALEKEVDSQASYPTVKWTMNQILLHEKLSAIPVKEWTHESTTAAVEAARSVADPDLVRRATDFFLAIRRGVRVEEALPLLPGSDLLSEDRLLKLKMHCEKIDSELTAVQSYITKYLELTAKKEKLAAKVVICPAGIDGVWISDNIISDEVAAKLKNEVAVLENVPDDEKDWHPHSKKQVLDLVHPSLFCCVFGQTLRASIRLDIPSFSTPLEQMQRLMFIGAEVVETPAGCNTAYQWIPTEFLIAEGGEPGSDSETTVRCLSYINNLHPAQHGDLYDSIGTILGRFVPLFERMLSDEEEGMPRSTFRVNMQCHDTSQELPPRPKVPKLKKLPERSVAVSLRGKTLQVIVKIAEINLTPMRPEYKGGAWHIEGTPAEKIVGTGIYYFGCENIKGSRLSFRAEVEEPPYQQNDDDGVAEVYGLFGNSLLAQELGSVETLESRCVVFPNTLQHQVQPFELEDPSKAGVRKILAFFLVDPEAPIPSTAVVPPQQQHWIEPTIELMIQHLHLVDALEQNIQSMLPRGMSLHTAKHHRIQLMEERAAAREDDEDKDGNSRYFSLCEH